MNKRGFTLIELLIVMTISGLFLGILFKTYTQMGWLSAKIQNEKNVGQDFLYVEHSIGNILEDSKIDYSNYIGDNLTNGWTDKLFLKGEFGNTIIYITGECYNFRGSGTVFSENIKNEQCRIEANISGKIIQITNPNKVYVSNFIVKLLPSKYYTGDIINYFSGKNDRKYIQNQAIHVYGFVWTRNWSRVWITNVQKELQLFYNL